MPTENRSSNTEMVSVPRDKLQAWQERFSKAQIFRESSEVQALLAQPIEHHQGEPVALPERKSEPTEESDVFADAENSGFNACLDEIAKMGPLYSRPVQGKPVAWIFRQIPESQLEVTERWDVAKHLPYDTTPVYTHADPGEVEQLTAEIAELLAERNDLRAELEEELGGWKERCRKLNEESMAWMRKHDTLRAQLADLKQRHDGLHRDMATIAAREVPKGCTVADYAAAAIADALSASAEPSAPASCTWTYNEDSFAWDTTCSESFMLMEDGPKENCMKFCPYCSKSIMQADRSLES